MLVPQTRNILASLASLLIYLALSVLFFGRSLAGHLSNFHVGTGTDPSVMMWMLAWWSHAIGRRLNVFVTHAIWAPSGFNLAWATCIPLAAWISIPLTRIFGPVVSYNLLCLIAPALASWTAFILCRYVTKSFWPSLLGGYIFGFSSYMLGQMFGNLPHLLVFPVPLVVYLVVRKLAGDIRTASFVMLLALVLVMQFLLTIEIVATMTMFGAMAIALGNIIYLGRSAKPPLAPDSADSGRLCDRSRVAESLSVLPFRLQLSASADVVAVGVLRGSPQLRNSHSIERPRSGWRI